MAIKKDILDQLLAGRDPKEVFAKDGLLDDLKKAFGALRKVPNKRHQSLVQQENSQKNAHFRDFPEVSILAHGASFHSTEKTAPLKSGIKQF